MHCKRVQCRPRADYRATSATPKKKRYVTLLDSLFDAIIRLDGDALVMHVGEKPYVVLSSASVSALRGPLAWGQVELSSRPLSASAMASMLTQMLTDDQRRALDDLGAIEEEIEVPGEAGGRFIVTAARGGGDGWVEVRRRKEPEAVAVTEPPETAQVDADVQPAESFDLPVAAEASPLQEEVWNIEPVAESESLEVASAPLLVESTAPAAISEHALAERVAALEREAAETLAAREAELASEAEAVLASRRAELEATTARALAEKEATLASNMDAVIAAKQTELVDRMEAAIAAKSAEVAAKAESEVAARQADLQTQLESAFAARQADLQTQLESAFAARQGDLQTQLESAFAARQGDLQAQLESASAARQAELQAQFESAIAAHEAAARDAVEQAFARREAALK